MSEDMMERRRLTGAPLRASVARQSKPRKRSIKTVVKSQAEQQAEKALEALAWLAEHASSEAVRVSAANAVLDRALGKPMTGARPVRVSRQAPAEPIGPGELEVVWLDQERS
jgi:hypothetical protein